MRALMKILFILLGVGIIFVMISVIFLPEWDLFANTFESDDDYGDLITYTEDEMITDLKLELENRHIKINYVDDEVLTIDYYQQENDTFEFSVLDGMLIMSHDFDSFWLNIFSFNRVSRTVITVTVNIPETWALDVVDLKTMTGDIDMSFNSVKVYDEVKLFNHTGDMHIEHVEALRLNAHTSTGDITISDVETSESFIVSQATGDMTLSRIDTDTFDVQSSTGDVVITSIHANDGDINLSTGDITISNSTFDQLEADVSTGKINLNYVISNRYSLDSSTGDIKVVLSSLEDLRFDLETDTGKIKINDQSQGKEYQSFTGTIDFIASTNTGNITIEVDA